MNAITLAPTPPRRWRAALALLAAVLLAHVLLLAWVASDLGELVVNDSAPSQLAVVMLPAAAPPVAPSPPPAPSRKRAAGGGAKVAAASPAAPLIEPAYEPPAPVEMPAEAALAPEAAAPEGESLRAAAPATLAVPLPPSGRLVYHLTHSRYPGTVARTVVEWSTDAAAQTYELRLQAALGGIALLGSRSTGQIDASGFVPQRYTQRAAMRAEVAVNFDWPAARVTYSASRDEHPLARGVQDPLSIQFQVPVLVQQAGGRLAPGQTLKLVVARPNKLDAVDFTVRGTETVSTGAGQTVSALRLEAPRGPDADQAWEFWLAPDLYWLPVRIRLVDRRGNVWDNVLAALPGTPEPAPPDPTKDPYRGS